MICVATDFGRCAPLAVAHAAASTRTCMTETPIPNPLQLRAGEWVEVRSKQEILSTLDERGQLEHMPFMPEMFQFCGRRFRVSKRAHKTCDPVNGLESRRLPNSVHLEALRCDGSGHSHSPPPCLTFSQHPCLNPS